MDFVSLAIAVMLFLRIEKAKGKSFGRYFHPGASCIYGCLKYQSISECIHCASCIYGCLKCQGINGCIHCQPGMFLYIHDYGRRQKGFCVYRCPVGFYGDRSRYFSECKKCPQRHCRECFDPSYCMQCVAPTYRHKGKCIKKCTKGYYEDERFRMCTRQVHCKVGPWSAWSTCSRNDSLCGHKRGWKERTREIVQHPQSDGRSCPKLRRKKRCLLPKQNCI